MSSLINTIDETISFNEETIRVVGTYEQPLFVASDICKVLGIANVTDTLKSLPEKWKQLGDLEISEVTFSGKNGLRKTQTYNCITEAGLYRIIMRSNKPIAKKFQEVVCEEILPSLRKKGEYKIQSIIDKNKALEEEKLRLEEEKQKILEDKEHEIKFKEYQLIKINEKNKKLESKLEKKRRARYEQTHSVYIISNPSIKGVCEKTGKKKFSEYKELSITGQYLYEIPTLLPHKKLEKFTNEITIAKCPSYLQTRFKLIEKPVGDFVGFQLEGDGRFLLSDFSTSHNTPEGMVFKVNLWFKFFKNSFSDIEKYC
jgi:prophage antirepressor-like protein